MVIDVPCFSLRTTSPPLSSPRSLQASAPRLIFPPYRCSLCLCSALSLLLHLFCVIHHCLCCLARGQAFVCTPGCFPEGTKSQSFLSAPLSLSLPFLISPSLLLFASPLSFFSILFYCGKNTDHGIYPLNTFFKKRCYLFLDREKGGRKRGRESSMGACFLCAPYWWPGSQLRHVPLMGIELATLWFSGWCSIH